MPYRVCAASRAAWSLSSNWSRADPWTSSGARTAGDFPPRAATGSPATWLWPFGNEVSLVDIAWYVYSARLLSAGYSLHRLYPRVGAWHGALHARFEFAKEVKEPSFLLEMREQMHVAQDAEGSSLRQVTGW